jgi:signal transduction histidine kinase/CheY-like chemotaxis protein
MSDAWKLLVVDDEPDIHQVTKLALKHRLWRKRPFSITSAKSAAEAMALLKKEPDSFQVALVDVVMETDDAGLELCKFIRAQCPSSLRLILRTGQPGVAPEEYVLNEYDIDYYLSKSEATPDKLYSVARACLRSSQDIATLIAFGKQLQSFSRALQNISSLDDLLIFMIEGLRFLELKHSAKTAFVPDANANLAITGQQSLDTQAKTVEICTAIRRAAELGMPLDQIHAASTLGLGDTTFVVAFKTQVDETTTENTEGTDTARPTSQTAVLGGLYVELRPDLLTEKTTRDFHSDAVLFIDNWKIAYSTLRLQERLSRERLLREKMYYDRLQSIATMVTGVAHELNTPLGVSNTAASMIVTCANAVGSAAPGTPQLKEVVDDLSSSAQLLMKNIARAHDLVKSFKQLSASQLSDQRATMNLFEIVRDCVSSMTPETKKKKIVIDIASNADDDLSWDGYPGHLTQVVVNFIQNSIRYAYPDGTGGKIDVRLKRLDDPKAAKFRIEFQDYGKGVSAEILPRLFEPFVTSGRSIGGSGLGLAISRNIVTNLLHGTIECHSKSGEGAKFTVDIPTVIPEAPANKTN